MYFKLNLICLFFITFLVGCSSQSVETTSIGEIPTWILNPQTKDGIAVSACVSFSGNMSIDRQHALANARGSLAQRIETRVSVMDKTYRNKISNPHEKTAQSDMTFSSVNKQVTHQTLNGTTVLKTDIVKIAGKDNLCVLVAIGQNTTKNIFNQLIEKSKRPVSNEQKDLLYQEFKAQNQLNLALKKYQSNKYQSNKYQ